MKSVLTSLFILISINSAAEYRVYQYYIKAKNKFAIDQNPYLVTSTLDPQTYLAYHGGPSSLKVDLLRSWMCYGHTGKKEFCPPPIQNDDLGGNE